MHHPHEPHEPHRVLYHVYPSEQTWVIQREGEAWDKAVRSSLQGPTLDSRERAFARAKELAQRHEFSCVIVHRADGSVEEECSYGTGGHKRAVGE